MQCKKELAGCCWLWRWKWAMSWRIPAASKSWRQRDWLLCEASGRNIGTWSNKTLTLRFPGGPVVKNLPCNARNTGLSPGSRRFHNHGATKPSVPQLLSLHAGALKLQLLKSKHPKACAPQQEKSPQKEAHAPQLEKAQAQQPRPSIGKGKRHWL